MAKPTKSVYEQRGYSVTSTTQAKSLAKNVLSDWGQNHVDLRFGLPEVDDRYHVKAIEDGVAKAPLEKIFKIAVSGDDEASVEIDEE